jgi:hypothetical protein
MKREYFTIVFVWEEKLIKFAKKLKIMVQHFSTGSGLAEQKKTYIFCSSNSQP